MEDCRPGEQLGMTVTEVRVDGPKGCHAAVWAVLAHPGRDISAAVSAEKRSSAGPAAEGELPLAAALRGRAVAVVLELETHSAPSAKTAQVTILGRLDEELPGSGDAASAAICASRHYYALLRDGLILTWASASARSPAPPSPPAAATAAAVGIAATARGAFALWGPSGCEGHSVTCWGSAEAGADTAAASRALAGAPPIAAVHTTDRAFCALHEDGSVSAWGAAGFGGAGAPCYAARRGGAPAGRPAAPLSPVLSATATAGAFCVLRSDGSVDCWGGKGLGGEAPTAALASTHVLSVAASSACFAALAADGSCLAWGPAALGGRPPVVVGGISLCGAPSALAALTAGGRALCWGLSSGGGAQHRRVALQGSKSHGGAAAALSVGLCGLRVTAAHGAAAAGGAAPGWELASLGGYEFGPPSGDDAADETRVRAAFAAAADPFPAELRSPGSALRTLSGIAALAGGAGGFAAATRGGGLLGWGPPDAGAIPPLRWTAR
eukprot:TRINITY_DN10372_c4_g1_i2.p2 TRINITY_DN10372_c4_g1~~TRINITY_DN10372_c4_g1_i2.p2  ORF type:complete len:497 (+),score=116.69 TRINITY_DN10372_c4_g1_i2:1169-2659(+)